MTMNPIPQFLLQDYNFRALSEKEQTEFSRRLSYIKEISNKRIMEDQDPWFYISSLQIDIWAVLSSGDSGVGVSVLSVERWAAYVDSPQDVRALALSRIEKLYIQTPNMPPNTEQVRAWLNDWSVSLTETLDAVTLTSDPSNGLISLVAVNCLLYVAMAFFS